MPTRRFGRVDERWGASFALTPDGRASTYALVVAADDSNGPEDWSYLHRSQDFRRDMRWAVFPWALIRGISTWIRGKDPVEERRQAQLAREQSQSAERFAEPEREAYRSLAEDRNQSPEES
jgi:hypothetical protein